MSTAIPASTAPAAVSRLWQLHLALLGITLGLLLLLFRETALTMPATWERSETFAHGWLILPISLWLAWRDRDRLNLLVPRTNLQSLLPALAAGGLWLAGEVTGTLIVQQYALIALLVSAVWGLLGSRITWELSFPLAFLFLAVPVGEGLIPPLMDFTAHFAVWWIRLTGIPVFQEGLFITLPSGDWSVVEGCSGLRYLIATITLGCLYAYLSYRSPWRRLLFIMASLLVPVIANGFRAYLIMMIGHLSSMKLAGGVDHLLYGWVFFGMVIFLMFSVGAIWRESGTAPLPIADPVPDLTHGFGGAPAMAGLQLAAAGIFFLWSHFSLPDSGLPPLSLPEQLGAWRQTATPLTAWRPEVHGADLQQMANYQNAAGVQLQVEVSCFAYSRQDHELLNSQNRLVRQKHPDWQMLVQPARSTGMAVPARVHEAEIRGRKDDTRLWVWDWRWLSGTHFLNPHYGKLREAAARLVGQPTRGCWLVLAAPLKAGPEAARLQLGDLAQALATWQDQTSDSYTLRQ